MNKSEQKNMTEVIHSMTHDELIEYAEYMTAFMLELTKSITGNEKFNTKFEKKFIEYYTKLEKKFNDYR